GRVADRRRVGRQFHGGARNPHSRWARRSRRGRPCTQRKHSAGTHGGSQRTDRQVVDGIVAAPAWYDAVRMSEYSIGLDLGGTNLRAAAVDRSGKMLDK